MVCFSSIVFFPALIFCLFLLKCSDVHLCSLSLIISWTIKWCIQKYKTLEAGTLRGLLKVVQNGNMWRFFMSLLITWTSVTNNPRVFIANFENFLHGKRSILFNIVFIKQIFFTFLDLLTLNFLLYSDCSKCARF